ncbi:MAG: PCYCGC motif-containing (lipo)protein [Paenibacillaceae bacterium]
MKKNKLSNNRHSASNNSHRMPNGDTQETTNNTDNLPVFLENQRKEIILVYQLAARNTELLQWSPCYCGCADSAGHKSNLNCFIAQTKSDGTIIWDDHGTRCDVCLKIAAQSIQMKEQGKTTKEIREYIDTLYKKGYAPPTLTPMPTA